MSRKPTAATKSHECFAATAGPRSLGEVEDDELYAALDWLLVRQLAIEMILAKRHLKNGTLVLYDVSSSYMEGRCCRLAKRGYSRDGKKGTLQIAAGRYDSLDRIGFQEHRYRGAHFLAQCGMKKGDLSRFIDE